MRKKITTPPEIKKVDQKEAKALEEFKKQAEKTLTLIQENHFHLRLWKAIGGED